MKILFDTSYFLPLIEIEVEKIPQNILLKLLQDNTHEINYSELSLFEMAAKGMKLAMKEESLLLEDIRIGVDSIRYDPRFKSLTWVDNPYILELAFDFRKYHKDTIDCLIFATAVTLCDCIATLDHTFHRIIIKNEILRKKVKEINSDFKFWFDDLSKNPISIDG